ncbi:dienelactone hydrolase [Jatrophihabitans sp. GAS493]|uniref:dienelactone hydrolase family protein n=1 Tax=Jatrophihabitans sp. GAS493 TaxID=1907575 RepID=UPI000BB76953|nr:dienelactone hydrolase family protein [Jatrophihabitans sp. GAS493]SOD70879.1 dienelactone hydrolase [Jatrophihabitans sp. GAS493]
MPDIALFHSVLGVRQGVLDAALRLTRLGHRVVVVDQYEGREFDDYDEAGEFAESIGYPALMQRALTHTAEIPDGFVAAGFSNGGGMAEFVATRRRVAGVLMLSGALPLEMLGVGEWPAGVPAQIHYAVDDPFRRQAGIDSVVASIRAAGGDLDVYDYPGRGHLFTDKSLEAEYDARSAALLWERVSDFLS